MNPLHTLTGSEKARLLHNLFPNEMQALLKNIGEFCAHFSEHQETYRKDWTNGFMPFDYWLSLSEETAGLLKRHTSSMAKSSKVFSEQLYFSYTSVFVTDRIIKYAERVSANEKFKLAVSMFFT